MSSTHTLSPGGEPQLGRPRFCSPAMGASGFGAHEGRHPMNLLPPPMTAEVMLAGNGLSRGICPVSRFSLMLIWSKLLMSSTHNGNSPDSRLFARYKYCRLEISPSSDGIGPVRLLLLRYSCVSLIRLPSSGGIGPLRLLLWRRS